jgi:hypothetical protein
VSHQIPQSFPPQRIRFVFGGYWVGPGVDPARPRGYFVDESQCDVCGKVCKMEDLVGLGNYERLTLCPRCDRMDRLNGRPVDLEALHLENILPPRRPGVLFDTDLEEGLL